MHFQKLTVLASALLAQEALAGSAHRFAHREYHDKKDVVYAHTEVETVVEWVTVTAWDPPESQPTKVVSVFKGHHSAPPPPPPPPPPAPTTTSTSSTSSSSSTSVAPVVPAPATTLATSIKPQVQVAQASQPPALKAEANVDVSVGLGIGGGSVSTPAASPTGSTGGSSGAPSGGNKRGLAYNQGNLLSAFLNSGTKCNWSYNWGQTKDAGAPDSLEFVPMMWGPGPNHEPTWPSSAEKAIAAGTKDFLSFNECDHPGQCNMSPSDTAAAHIRLMNPYQGRVRISAPAITNSNSPGQGIDWLKQFFAACNGKCAVDFCAAHWYSPADPDEFLSHMVNVHNACQGKPVWITEFAPFGSDDQIDAFLKKVMNAMDNDPKYNFIERYSYFMVGPGSMISSGTSLSSYGKTFAYGS
ncbi:uncharacterized protein E0L32_008049 [Thyridium curvatum]|uniref:Asl1-like glycosyl hydrolase catalytic domain-containing protein n=1 Tax=Thyridium curvatum TaxID=1093900 RepID=A0A507AME6_9PEZI|nr:uncharacterized protein E0L32_008049 [Thyridium curvatum]TPX11012.1 hypothetical protein E0L32_008049 [Thyridium curvatum]